MKHILVLVLLLIPLTSQALPEESPGTTIITESDSTYIVGVKHAPPFAYLQDGEWAGLTIDLINTIAKNRNWEITYQDRHTISDLLTSLQRGEFHFAGAAISTTAEREQHIDFSQPYHSSPIGILSKTEQNIIWWVITRILFAFGALVILMYMVGAIVDKLDGDISIKTPHDGAWWAIVTFTTTGYGDVVPQSGAGKLLASGWMLTSMFLASVFTGYVASGLTVMIMESSQSESITLEDAYRQRVIVVEGASSEQLLNRNAIEYTPTPSLMEGRSSVINGTADMLIHDRDILERVAISNDNLVVSTVPNQIDYYALAVPTGSDLREVLNVEIMNIMDTLYWEKLLKKYFPN